MIARAAFVLAVAVGIGAASGSSETPRSLHRTAIAGIPTDAPGQFATSWSWVKGLYRGPVAADSTTAKVKR